ncbi:alkaline phosphatase [bacterium]|nr:alkaline phosphatase [bacterium]
MRKYIFAVLAFSLALALNADVIQGLRTVNKIMQQVVPPEEQAAAQETQAQGKKPKYIFYFIGDGMGINQVQMGIDYKAQTTGGKEELNMQKFPIMGANRTYCLNSFVTDSSASGTALATGHKTNYGVAGIDANGDAIDSVAVYCHNRGMKVGIVATVTLMEATPGAFFMHQGYRGRYYPGTFDLVDSGFEYFAGGDLWDKDGIDFNEAVTNKLPEKTWQEATNVLSRGVVSCLLDKDGKPVIKWKNSEEIIKENGYKYVDTEAEFNALQPGCGKVYISHPCKAWGIPYRVGYKESPFLKDFVKKGIELLDNENGFFMMCEGSFIDHGGHSNDAPKTLYELLDFDDAIGVALEFYNQHPDETLIVVTADHETGALSYGYVGDRIQDMKGAKCEFGEFKNKFKEYRDKVRECKENHSAQLKGDFSEAYALIKKWYGDIHLSQGKKDRLKKAFEASMDPNYNKDDPLNQALYEGHDPFCFVVQRELNAHFGAKYNTGGHSAAPTPVFAIGVGAEMFGGFKENTNNAISMEKLVDPNGEIPSKPYKKPYVHY